MITLAMGIASVVFPLDKLMGQNAIATSFLQEIPAIGAVAMEQIADTKGLSVISVSSAVAVWSATKGCAVWQAVCIQFTAAEGRAIFRWRCGRQCTHCL